MKNQTCIIVEDEQLAIDLLLSYVEKIPFLSCAGAFPNAIEAYSFLYENSVDIIFVDIDMPGMKGTDFVKSLRRNYKIIFTTACEQSALEAFELNAIDYLTKPIEFNRFIQALNKATLYNISTSENKTNAGKLFIKVDGKIINISLNEILYIQGMQRYTQIFTKNNKYTSLTSLFKLSEHLPKDKFLRVHKSYIINIDNISCIEGNMIKINNETIPISKGKKDQFFKDLDENIDILYL
ncbi:response regulator transcription factor [Ancylomarina salipaludis]|uniref:Response regulator transcription factor n=1 Tax=Ancylomarina salipaludis TaxID=2501299 RepID=A0A4Q1JL22_9BACT|nr:LytTR family DNA-binding domain-containing protein [Ancylomarina salipaludis]RXQ92185.1 response regulator transcription factor [Ancylomarina salipaludis]